MIHRRFASWLVGSVTGVALLVPAGTPQPAAGAPARSSALAVTGFQEAGDPLHRITASAAALTTVGVDGVDLYADGHEVGVPGRAARRALDVAHADRLRAEFVVNNFGRRDFDEARAHRLLSDPAAISSVAGTLANAQAAQGWDGVSVDLEALRGRDRAGLVDFLGALRSAMPPGSSLSVCISNSVTAAGYRAGGYDLRGIAANVDRIILMAYDEHGTWENRPGPVGGIDWQRRGLAAMERIVPPDRIDLGQAGYGYAWRPHRNVQLSDTKARHLVRRDHGRAHYDRAAGEWTATLRDGSTLWWADARSYQRRVRLATHDRLHGLAVWSLGLSDRLRAPRSSRRT